MKSKNEFDTIEEYKEYLLLYYMGQFLSTQERVDDFPRYAQSLKNSIDQLFESENIIMKKDPGDNDGEE